MTAFFVSDCLLILLCCIATGYAVTAALVLAAGGNAPWRARRGQRAAVPRPVSVFKPLCGAEPRLYENLATFCEQNFPRFQLLFGVSSPVDPAIAVVQRLQAAYPSHDIELVVDSRVHGQNLKVSNLINMAAHAKHDVVIIADSDIAVEPNYLETVTAPLARADVGIVTCLYRAVSVGGFWPRVGALFINEWFAPSVRVSHAGGSTRFGFGATLALRRDTLERIGGFPALKDDLADDYWLAEHSRRLGLRTVLSEVTVATDVVEPDLSSLWLRETRWLRTIRSINPLGFSFLFITFTTPWLLAGLLLAHGFDTALGSPRELVLAVSTGLGALARIALHAMSVRHGGGNVRTFWRDLPLVPLRDLLLALQWLAAAFGSYVVWRGARVPVVTARASVVVGSDGS
jgi:ceramide glucosyltransferase